MAIDKAVDSAVLDANLTSIADAIRAKAGTSDKLAFPAGFADAIAAIEAGGGKVTYGTLTPLDYVFEIEHGLGEKPKAFIWIVTFNHTMTGRIMSSDSRIASDEQAYDSADFTNSSGYKARMVFFLMGDYFYSTSYSSSIDWGFFTRGSVEKQGVDSIVMGNFPFMFLDENCFKSGGKKGSSIEKPIIPHSTEGNVTIHWFAIGA